MPVIGAARRNLARSRGGGIGAVRFAINSINSIARFNEAIHSDNHDHPKRPLDTGKSFRVDTIIQLGQSLPHRRRGRCATAHQLAQKPGAGSEGLTRNALTLADLEAGDSEGVATRNPPNRHDPLSEPPSQANRGPRED